MVTKYVSEIAFISAPDQGDIVEIRILATAFGRTSITLRCEVRNKLTCDPILSIDKLIFVNVDEKRKPAPHGKTQVCNTKDRFE